MDSIVESPCHTFIDQPWIQFKNTGFIHDVFGPFADEPILTAVDKTLYYSADICSALCAFREAAALTLDTDEVEAEPRKQDMLRSSQCSMSDTEQERKSQNRVRISQSLSNLSELRRKDMYPAFLTRQKTPPSPPPPPKPLPTLKSRHSNYKVPTAPRQWIEKKTASGVKSYEVWSSEGDQPCPSIVFIVSPSGDIIPFESLPQCVR